MKVGRKDPEGKGRGEEHETVREGIRKSAGGKAFINSGT